MFILTSFFFVSFGWKTSAPRVCAIPNTTVYITPPPRADFATVNVSAVGIVSMPKPSVRRWKHVAKRFRWRIVRYWHPSWLWSHGAWKNSSGVWYTPSVVPVYANVQRKWQLSTPALAHAACRLQWLDYRRRRQVSSGFPVRRGLFPYVGAFFGCCIDIDAKASSGFSIWRGLLPSALYHSNDGAGYSRMLLLRMWRTEINPYGVRSITWGTRLCKNIRFGVDALAARWWRMPTRVRHDCPCNTTVLLFE